MKVFSIKEAIPEILQ